MDDTISRAAVLEIIREHCPDKPKSKDLREYWEKRFEPLIKVREEIEKMPLADGWIPCSDGLPKKDGRYQVTRYDYVTNTEFVDILWYEENIWWNRHSTGDYAVTAWMPLPAAYQEGGKE